MKKNKMGRRILAFILTSAIILTTQGRAVLATEYQEGEETETHDDVVTVGSGSDDTDSLDDAGNSDDAGDSGDTGSLDNTGDSGDTGSLDNTGDSGDADSLGGTDDSDDIDALNDADGSGEVVTDDASNTGSTSGLPADLTPYIVEGLNPEGAIVNLFDYHQNTTHDYLDESGKIIYTYNQGISANHLLRFGYRDTGGTCAACLDLTKLSTGWWGAFNNGDATIRSAYYDQGFFGDWNEYNIEYNIDTTKNKYGGLREGIVQKVLSDGFPRLNLNGTGQNFFGNYVKDENFANDYGSKTTESLSYLFSPDDTTADTYRKSYTNVQGLFQRDANGYYYYNSEINFAELNTNTNKITLYNSPGVGKTAGDKTSTDYSEANYGQFFPFNTAQDVFDTVDDSDPNHPKLYYSGTNSKTNANKYAVDEENFTAIDGQYIKCYAPNLNHYLGMTLEVPFLQPENGEVANGMPMQFEFSGDDDVWIFIDDVLVADLGGIHDAYYLKIDFQTGNVSICKNSEKGQGSQASTYQTHTLKESFTQVGVNGVAFTGSTFASNTVHTLKMFYLERGHMASNLSLKFNLQVARYDQIKKVDQDGNPMPGVAFDLYAANVCSAGETGAIPCTTSTETTNPSAPVYVKRTGQKLATLTTNRDGIADFTGYSFSDSGGQYYILHENVPTGYRAPPVDIVLEYSFANTSTRVLRVANRWETGAYASFTSYVNERANMPIYYAQYNSQTGTIQAIDQSDAYEVQESSRQNGLVIAVPMLKNQNEWIPLYGSNVEGFNEIKPNTADSEGMKKALLEAALMQAALNASGEGEAWYLQWDNGTNGLVGVLTDLPGRADRYRLLNPQGDMQMAYIMIEPGVFTSTGVIGGSGSSSADRYTALKNYVGNNVKAAVEKIYGLSGTDVNLLDTSDFMRVFRALIYIPNVQRELRVKKIDESGQAISDAKFAIYTDPGCTQLVENAQGITAQGKTATVEGEEGILIFKPNAPGSDGYASIDWTTGQTYYLKETKAPDGYRINPTVIPIKVDAYSVYADAGGDDDGVSVEARVGHLYQTMTKYASDGEVNVTLHDINVTEQGKSSGNFDKESWKSSGNTLTLSYDNGKKDYLATNGAAQFFSTETGFISVSVKQGAYSGTYTSAIRDNLAGVDLTGLFSQLNVVVVKDKSSPSEQRELRVQKVNEKNEPLNGAEFGLYDEDGNLVASGTTAFVDGQNGVLIFQKKNETQNSADASVGSAGFAKWETDKWAPGNYYLQEISPPPGYQSNDQKIPVVVDGFAVYADAGTAEDGVSVRAGVGYYLDDANGQPPETITVSAQGQDSGTFDRKAWKDLKDLGTKKLSYKNYPTMGMDYGLTVNSSGTTPFFETDTGFLRNAVKDPLNQDNTAYITKYFSQLNIVVVKDWKVENPEDPESPENPDADPGTDPDEDPGTVIDTVREGIATSVEKLLDRVEIAKETLTEAFTETLTGTPQTGDDSLIWWWALLSITSLSGIGATVSNLIFRRRKQEKNPSKEKQKKQRPPKEKQKKQRPLKEKQKKQHPPKEKQQGKRPTEEKQEKQRLSKRKRGKPSSKR